jgi:hypothetical protein
MTALSQIAADLRRLGLALPKPLADAQRAADAFLARVPRDDAAPLKAALDALEDGRDPYSPDVQRELAAYQLSTLNISYAARLRVAAKLSEAVVAQADSILGLLADRLQEPAAAMVEAHRLRVSDLREARTLRGQQLSAWGRAAEAVDAFAVAHQVVGSLYREMPARGTPDKLRVLAAAPPARLQAARNMLAADNRIAPAWALAVNDIPIAHIRSLDELARRDNIDIDGTVQPPEPDDQPASKKPRSNATVSG